VVELPQEKYTASVPFTTRKACIVHQSTIVRQALFSSRYCDIVVIIIFYILVVTQFEILENNVLNLI